MKKEMKNNRELKKTMRKIAIFSSIIINFNVVAAYAANSLDSTPVISTLSKTTTNGAGDFNSIFQEGINTGNGNLNKPQDAVNKHLSNPAQTFKGYDPAPANQTKYYGDETQGDDKNMAKDAANSFRQDPTGGAVYTSIMQRPDFKVDPNSQEMQRSTLISNDAANIANGISDQYVDCKKTQTCRIEYITQACNELVRYVQKLCDKIPKITILDQAYTEVQNHSGGIAARDNYLGTFILPVSGTITSFDVQLKGPTEIWKCRRDYHGYLQGNFLSTHRSGCGDGLSDMSYHNHNLNIRVEANNPIVFSFQDGPSNGRWKWANYNLTIKADLHKKVPQIAWDEVCHNVN